MPLKTSSEPVRFECRPGCGACCIAPSITSAIPGMPRGKPAGVRCAHLDEHNLCRLFGHPDRPGFCVGFQASRAVCGLNAEEAMRRLICIETLTRPGPEITRA